MSDDWCRDDIERIVLMGCWPIGMEVGTEAFCCGGTGVTIRLLEQAAVQ